MKKFAIWSFCLMSVFPTVLSAEMLIKDGLVLYLDASELELNNGDFVSFWADLSGQNNHASMSGNRLPVYVAPGGSAFHRQAYIHFDGIDDRLAIPDTTCNVESFRFIIVARSQPWGINEWLLGSTGTEIQLRRLETGGFRWRVDNYYADVPSIPGNEHLFELECFNTTVRGLFDGQVKATGTSTATGHPTSLNLAGNPSFDAITLLGDIAEVIAFDRPLSTYEQNYVGYYLERKYGLSTLYPVTYAVDAGDNQTVALTQAGIASTTIEGVISPYFDANDVLAVQWTQVSGPDTAQIDDNTAMQTGVSFPSAGLYTLRFALAGTPTVNDTVTIKVNYAVDAGEDQIIVMPTSGTAVTTVTGTIIPDDPLAVQWSQVDGPTTAVIDDDTAEQTTVSFFAIGVYTLKLALAGDPDVSDTVTITVGLDPYSGGMLIQDGLVLYLDATELALNNGDLVALWPDLSSAGNNASIVGTRTPAYVAPVPGGTDFDGKAYLHFDGIDDRLALPDTTCSVGSFRWIIVARSDPHGVNEWLVGSTGVDIQLRRLATGGFRWRIESYLADVPDIPGGVHLFEIDHFNNTLTGLWDGMVKTTGACTDSGYPIGLNLGGNPTFNNQPLLGDIAEVIVFNRPLTEYEENYVGYYLARKYGLTTVYSETYMVDAGGDQVLSISNGQAAAYLTAMVSPPNDSLVVEWSVVSGPAAVDFADSSAPRTTATFTQVGDYVLRCAVAGSPQSADTVAITIGYLPADYNASGIVDISDFSVIAAQWLTTPVEHRADLNNDQAVDLLDIVEFVDQWLYSAPE